MRRRLLIGAFLAGILGLLAVASALKRTNAPSNRRGLHHSQKTSGRPAGFDLRESLVETSTVQKAATATPAPASATLLTGTATSSDDECCSIEPLPPLNVSLTYPMAMRRPIRIFMQTGHVDAAWPCDVPCEYSTSLPAGGDVDVIVGEAGAPTVPAQVRRLNPSVLTAARSMESSVNYPLLRQLPSQVGAVMTTSLSASTVPVVYLTRSSVRKWSTPAVWNGDM